MQTWNRWFVTAAAILLWMGAACAKPTPPGGSSTPPGASPGETQANIAVQNVTCAYGDSVQLKATAPKPGIAGTYVFSVDGNPIGQPFEFDSSGNASQSFQPPDSLHVGSHTIKVSPSTATRGNLEGEGTLVMTKAKTALTLAGNKVTTSASPFEVYGTVYLTRVTDGTPIDGRLLTVTIQGQNVGSLTTHTQGASGSGMSQFSVQSPEPSAQGQVSFAGDNLYLPSNVSFSFSIPVKVTTPVLTIPIEASYAHMTFGDETTIPVTLETDHHGPIAGRNVQVTLSTGSPTPIQSMLCKTDDKGKANCKFRVKLPPGQYFISAYFAGDELYNSVSANAQGPVPTAVVTSWGDLVVDVPSTLSGRLDTNLTFDVHVHSKVGNVPVPAGSRVFVTLDPQAHNSLPTDFTTDDNGFVKVTLPLASNVYGIGQHVLEIQGPSTQKVDCPLTIQPANN